MTLPAILIVLALVCFLIEALRNLPTSIRTAFSFAPIVERRFYRWRWLARLSAWLSDGSGNAFAYSTATVVDLYADRASA